MRTDFPTKVLYFTFAFTFCKLTFYTEEESFVREVLTKCGVSDWLEAHDSESWQEFDTRIILSLVREAIPKIFEDRLKKAREEFVF